VVCSISATVPETLHLNVVSGYDLKCNEQSRGERFGYFDGEE
jgi:hypothetical protein